MDASIITIIRTAGPSAQHELCRERGTASGILKALGGKDNIVKVDYCATRLRFEVHSYASVDEAAAKAAGAEGVIRPAKNACQVVIKGDVQAVYDALRKQL